MKPEHITNLFYNSIVVLAAAFVIATCITALAGGML